MALPQTYVVRLNIANPTASTTLPQLQIAAAAAKPLEIFQVEMNQETSATSSATALEIVRSTTTAPGTLTGALTPVALNPSDAAAACAVNSSGFSGALTGSQFILNHWGFNILNGQNYNPVPEARQQIPGGGFFWLRLPVTVPAATYNLTVTFREIG